VIVEMLALGLDYARKGQMISVVQEGYAYLAQFSRGDLDALPSYLRDDYSDYLQPGTNIWMQRLANQERQQRWH
jgi:hypothetical protein